MTFVDQLAFWEATLLIGAVLLGYVGFTAFWAMRHNDAEGLKSVFRGAAAPVGGVGAVATMLGVWSEAAWPLPGSYNILFTDIYLLFGLTLVMLAISMAASLKLQYAGLLGLVAGGVTIAYGWQGYQLGMTKEPLQMFLLYGAFGLAGILSFPATVVADYYLAHPDGTAFALRSGVAVARRRPSIQAATRGVQPVVPTDASGTPDPAMSVRTTFHLPIYISATLLVFVVSIALAGVAALFYLDSTLPAHLASAP